MIEDFYFERFYLSSPQDTSQVIQDKLGKMVTIDLLEHLVYIRLHKRLFGICSNENEYNYMFKAIKNLTKQSIELQKRAKPIN